jgi:serine/threonine protein kinase
MTYTEANGNTPAVVLEEEVKMTDGGVTKNGKSAKGKEVSFRGDVAFGNSIGISARSAISTASSSEDGSKTSGSKQSFTKLRSKLTREQMNRDPFYFYQVTRNLGEGSMGDVKLVKKRPDKVGGSARRDIQAAVRRQKEKEACFQIPLVGSIMRLFIDDDLKDEPLTENEGDGPVDPSSRHSAFSFLSSKTDVTQQSGAARSFEDSLSANSPSTASEVVYAMKSILLEQLGDQSYVDELRNEIALLRALDHPNIVRAIETFEYRKRIYIVMELCSGGDLYSREPYTEIEAARILSSILSAVAYMHSRNVVHRDLKFENVLFSSLSPMSDVKVIDFGLSKVYKDSRKMADVVGTVYTMAPEVIMGDYTEKADMWSIGVIAFMLLSSSMPFYGKDRVQVIRRILNNKYHFKARRWVSVSQEAKAFVQELLVTEPEDRPDAESALGSAWLNSMRADGTKSDAEEEAMAQAAMLKFADYPKLKKMVSVKEEDLSVYFFDFVLLIYFVLCSEFIRHSWWWLTSLVVKKSVFYASCLQSMTLGITGISRLKIFVCP